MYKDKYILTIGKIFTTIAQRFVQLLWLLMVTLNYISEKMGLSVTTVSRALNNKSKKYRISKETEARVQKVANELGYKPNTLARGLRLKKTYSIGLVIPDISNPFFAFVAKTIQTYGYNNGYSTIVCNTDEQIQSEIEQIELLRSKAVDGFIIMPVGTESKHIEELLNDNYPLVLLDRCFQSIQASSVLVDNYFGAYSAVEHVIKKGHTKIAIIQGLPKTYTNTERVKGYTKALEDNNIVVCKEFIVGKDYGIDNGYIETKMLLNMVNRPTAIFSTGDMITVGVLKALGEEKLKIPSDISLVAFDDTYLAPYLCSPLTSIRQPKDLMGQMAIKMIIEAINKKKNIDSQIVLKPKLIIRKSVKSIK